MRWKRHERRLEEAKASYSAVHPDVSLAELHDRATAPAHWDIDQDDAGHLDGDYAAQDKRIHELLGVDDEGAPARASRRSWPDLKRLYSRNPGVEQAGITSERTERYEAEQRAIQARLLASAGQPENRFNGATRGAVGSRGAESRQLNRRPSASIPAPSVGQRYVFSAPEPAPSPRPGAPRDEDFWR
jgi:hypothetical protein